MFPRMVLFLFLCVVSFAVPQMAEGAAINRTDIAGFSELAVMHEGRIKPIDSFARSVLKDLSGKDHMAAAWLAETLFNPAVSENRDVLKISSPDVLNMLEIEKRKSRLYSYREISHALRGKEEILLSILKTPQEEWTPGQKTFVSLQQKTVLLGDLLTSMNLFLPLSVQIPEDAPKALQPFAGKALTYLDVSKFHETLQKEMKAIVRKKGENIESYSEAQRAIAYLSFAFTNMRQTGARSYIFRVLPVEEGAPWASPWAFTLGQGRPESAALFKAWGELAMAYHEDDPALWRAKLGEIKNLTGKGAGAQDALRPAALKTEYIYNHLRPFVLTAWLYGLCLVALFVGGGLKRKVYFVPAALLGTGLCVHVAGILSRIFILQRPPVSTLYESFLFVGLMAALYGFAMYLKNKDRLWLYLGAGCGFFITLVSFTHNQEGDSFLMLTAVLNTNFWLATHVICITLGYAFCLVTSVLAHAALIKPEQNIRRYLKSAALIALLFAAVGTVLGGIWADQSWGRFWGWDPKENGALLIVLWLIWFLHGRVSGQMKDRVVTAGLAYLSVIVSLSWFGVNLLSVGLHAYGFTDSAALGLGAFIGLETVLIGALVYRQRRMTHAV